MKKKNIIIGVVVIILLVIIVGVFTRPNTLGSIRQEFSEPTSSSSNISFTGEKGGKIKFSFRSNIESGDLDIILCDPNGDVVYELDKAKELETYYTLEKTDTYTLVAQYSDFVGDFKVIVYEVD